MHQAAEAMSAAEIQEGAKDLLPKDKETLEEWKRRMEGRFGEGTYPFFRALYKDLCEEMRREFFTKPPSSPGATGQPVTCAAPSGSSSLPKQEARGKWNIQYFPITNSLAFERPPVNALSSKAKAQPATSAENSTAAAHQPGTASKSEAFESAHIIAYAKVEVSDPPKLNALLTFANWCPVEVFIAREDVILHLSIACNEGGLHMRNVRVYDGNLCFEDQLQLQRRMESLGKVNTERIASSGVSESTTNPSSPACPGEKPEGEKASRKKTLKELFFDPLAGPAAFEDVRSWFYDGPCLWHLELDFQNELYDVMQDYGIDVQWVRWVSEWVFYYEHRITVRWMLRMLTSLIPPSTLNEIAGDGEDVESLFLTAEERDDLDRPANDWVREPLR